MKRRNFIKASLAALTATVCGISIPKTREEEDALVIYKLVRSPEREIHYVDTGCDTVDAWREGGMKRGEMNIITAGRSIGKSNLTHTYMQYLTS